MINTSLAHLSDYLAEVALYCDYLHRIRYLLRLAALQVCKGEKDKGSAFCHKLATSADLGFCREGNRLNEGAESLPIDLEYRLFVADMFVFMQRKG